tara:strand:- start:131 stop:577 length:447 start_codon:yes stop_codon:yes gene_type:complete
MHIIAANKRANFDYNIEYKIDAGIVLTGSEVKSLRTNTGSIKESYVRQKLGELWLCNCYIKKYSASNIGDDSPTRERKLLVSKKELKKVIGSIRKEGSTIVPINLFFNSRGLAKLTIGLGKGKKKYDKRESKKTQEWNIKKQRLLKNS